jgi:tRNA nucleotidyltransferase (CCA-adding enzyme)
MKFALLSLDKLIDIFYLINIINLIQFHINISRIVMRSTNKQKYNMCEIIDFSIKLTAIQKNKINSIKSLFLPFTNKIFIVGGFLRDQMLGIESDDIDIEIYDLSEELFGKLMEEIGAKPLSKEFFVYNFDGIDISLPRREIKTGEGYYGFKMELENNPKLAILRRDFSCNALMYHLYEEKLYDYHNGVSDIQNKILRVVSIENFKDDNVRFLRAIRMIAKYQFIPDGITKQLLMEMSLQDITKTKIEKELKKILF